VTAPTNPNTPRGYFGIWQRLLRGYGPLAVFAIFVVLISVLIPSKVHDSKDVSTQGSSSGVNGNDTGSDSGSAATDATTGGTNGAVATSGGAGTSGGSAGGTAAVAKKLACPDRQDQVPGDPYSPPCVSFSGNNGGATSKGVTATTIKVAYRVLDEKGFQQTLAQLAGASLVDSPATTTKTVQALADYFNSHFQFYGRKIQIVTYNGVGSNTNELLGQGRDKATADAITVAQQLGAFADVSATSEPYSGALADRHIVALGDPYLSRAWHVQRAPYTWSLATDGSIVSEEAADYQVKRLYGKNAIYAGGNGGDGKPLAGRPRKFATIAPENSWYQESVQNANDIITKAGKQPGLNRKYVLDLSTMSDQATGIIAQMKSQNITTIVCGCDPILPVFLSGVANRENYFPEFIIVGTALTDADIVGQLWNQNFAKHAFGVSSLNGFVPPTETIAYAAYKSVRKDEPAFSVDLIYYQMYMLAIGIQGAGPNLNPNTYQAGMFAYPPKLGPFGLWKFGPGDYTAANDVREIYWDPNAVSTYNGKRGAYLGTSDQRWAFGTIPAGDPGVPVPK
jgi:hypothetical protein